MTDHPTTEGRDALFDLPPEEFVAARDALARRLRAGGDRRAAEEVGGLRRPTVAAWAANQVARRSPEVVEALLEAGRGLIREQRRALSGVAGAELRGTARHRREAVGRAVAAAEGLLEAVGRDPAAHRPDLAATFEAASLGGEAGELLQRGQLTRKLDAPTDLDRAAGLAVVPPAEGEGEGEGAGTEQGPPGAGAGEAATAPTAAVEEVAKRARDRAAAAQEAAGAAAAQVERAQMRARHAEEAAERARAKLESAEAQVRTAREQVDAARAAAAEAAAEAERARDEADDLSEDARRASSSADREA